jgi:hypothetical protein
VIPYFGKSTTWKSVFVDSIHASIAWTRLILPRQIRSLKTSNGRSTVFSDGSFGDDSRKYDVSTGEVSVRFDIAETSGNFALRFLEMLDWVLETQQVDFIWHSNISTYLNLNRLQVFLNENESKFYYAGVIGNYLNFDFVSGASVCLGRDTAQLVVLNRNQWDHSLLWDVALGKLLNEHSIRPTVIDRIDLTETKEVQFLSEDQLKTTINFRCKSGRWRRKDHKIMNLLHERYIALE